MDTLDYYREKEILEFKGNYIHELEERNKFLAKQIKEFEKHIEELEKKEEDK